jgi:hypothetical protein
MPISLKEDTCRARVILEPAILRRWRHVKAVWNGFMFLARGGKFRVFLDLSGIDPRIVRPVKIFIPHDGWVVDVERSRRNAVSSATDKISRLAGLTLAKDDEPGFRVRWADSARKLAWEETGFDVTWTPDKLIVSPKGEDHD